MSIDSGLDSILSDHQLPIAPAGSIGMDEGRLQRISGLVQRYVDQRLIPGAVTMVARRGKICHFDANGYADVEAKRPFYGDSIFRIASMTKPITSVALMQLFEDGLLQLNDPIAKYLPAFAKMKVCVDTDDGQTKLIDADKPITVRHILTHTAGFATQYNPKNQAALNEAMRFRSRNEVIGDFVNRLADIPLNHQPGDVWDYSRSTCVVGHLVEVLSGQSLAEYFQKRIFDPLEMNDTHFFLPEEKLPRFAVAYGPGEDKTIQISDPASTKSFFASQPGQYFMGSGGLVSTAPDYFKFANALMQNGQHKNGQLLSRKTIELMTMNQIGNRWVWLGGAGQGFGLGFGISMDRGKSHTMATEGSYTWGGAFCTYWWNDPVEQLFGMILTQLRPYDHLNLRMDFQNIVTSSIID